MCIFTYRTYVMTPIDLEKMAKLYKYWFIRKNVKVKLEFDLMAFLVYKEAKRKEKNEQALADLYEKKIVKVKNLL